MAVVGVVVLFAGWVKLGLDIAEVHREPGPHPYLRRRLMWLAYITAWGALALGLISLTGQFPIPPPPITGGILRGFFPYVPSVYGPVVLGQAVILLLGTDVLEHSKGQRLSLVGISILLGLSFTGIAWQLGGPLPPAALFLPGMTAVGHLIVALAWIRYGPARNAATPRKAAERILGADAIPDMRTWRTWGRRRKAAAALGPGILLSVGGYVLSIFQECIAVELCTRPFVTLGLSVLGFGLFLIILGLVLWATA
ncbi:MAG: hypothetical protein R3291_02555 [Thermoplasmata archaeon]|nr:hypothetical protein [Thermoplasmata archaeon]